MIRASALCRRVPCVGACVRHGAGETSTVAWLSRRTGEAQFSLNRRSATKEENTKGTAESRCSA